MKLFSFAKQCFTILAIMLSFMIDHAYAQQVKASITYNQTILTNFEVSNQDLAKLYDFEKVDLKPITEQRSVSNIVDLNGDITTTVIINSSNAGEAWMNTMSKIVVNKSGVTTYDASGKILTNTTNTAQEQSVYEGIKSQIVQNGTGGLPTFTPLTESSITSLREQGFIVQNLPNGVVSLKKADKEVLYNNANKSYEIIRTENQVVTSRSHYEFSEVNGKSVPKVKIEKTYTTSSRGGCIGKVTTTIYSNYTRTDNNPR